MKPTLILNDVHIGAIRTGGTTPATAYKLRQNLLADFAGLLDMAGTDDVVINGDWLDTGAIPLADLLQVYSITAEWLSKEHKPSLWPIAGNHDLTKNSAVLSSFALLCSLLAARFPVQVHTIIGAGKITDGVFAVGHCENQDAFELELSRIPASTRTVLLHCNVNNTFAAKSDHSLNISLDQARTLNVETIIVGHEHQRSTHLGGKVLVAGNQIPSSVADCLGNDMKYALRITDSSVEWVPTWERTGSFIEMDWRELAPTLCDFVRVIGKASAAEASAVVTAISSFRKTSQSLVITNAVEVESVNDGERIEVSLEQIRSFSVLEELLKILNEDERAIVTKLLEKNEA